MSIINVALNRGLIWNDDGRRLLYKKYCPLNKRTFKVKNETYIIDHVTGSYFLEKGFLWDSYIFQYNVGNPIPKNMASKETPQLHADLLNTLMENTTARDINNLSRSPLSQLFSIKNIIIVSVIVAGIWYLAKNGLSGILGGTPTP